MGSIDADAHVIESPLTWAHIADADAQHTPMILNQSWGREVKGNAGRTATEYWLIDSRVRKRDSNIGTDTTVESREFQDAQARIDHMDELGIDIQVLYPSLFLRPAVRTAAAELALTKAYNRWLASINKHAPERLRWVALPPLLSPPDVIRAELAEAQDHGACGIFMRGLEWDKAVGDPYFYPLYEIATELGLPVCFHSGNGSSTHHDLFTEDTSFTTFKLAVVGAFHSLIEKDIPGKFPDLRWGFVEVSAQWVPYVCHDLRYRLRRLGRRMPENLLAENRMYVACEVTDDIPYILSYAGDGQIILGTDYGHHDPSSEINAFTLIRQRNDLTAEQIDRITNTNARALYGF
ncbi:MAG: putative TIM-barrel fold metal-dependent hydrolase [Alphaproteobacteria bacterium]|jgi:predicted TIM-barrel fold metal-dependent hydrolase